jgi:hypothetical protein
MKCDRNDATLCVIHRGRSPKRFDAPAARPLRCQRALFKDEMDSAPNDLPVERTQPIVPQLPKLWIGYLIGLANIIAEFVYVSRNQELAKTPFQIPPLYLFILIFVGWVYWLVCVHRYHVVMQQVPGWKHPISPGRAVGFLFIPGYNLYWSFKWPQEIARFVNWRFGQPVMNLRAVGLVFLAACVLRLLFDSGLGLILLCLAASYVSGCLRRAFALPPVPAQNPPSTE